MSSFKFDDFFDETIEYPGSNIGGKTILPPGTLYSYVGSSFLNGLINYAGKVIGAYVLERYQGWDQAFDEEDDPVILQIMDPPKGPFIDRQFNTKAEIHTLLTEPCRTIHSCLGAFQDDVLVLFKHPSGVHWFFWFDCDVSDCCVGRFNTDLPDVEVIQLFDRYVTDWQAQHQANTEARPIPRHYFNGWLSF